MIHKKESAGGFETTTADANHIPKIISLRSQIGMQLMRTATMLVTYLRRLA